MYCSVAYLNFKTAEAAKQCAESGLEINGKAFKVAAVKKKADDKTKKKQKRLVKL